MPNGPILGTLLSAGCDWLTATQAPGARAEMLLALARRQCEDDALRGQVVREWQWQGYTGEASRDFAYGSRHDGCIVRMHGTPAWEWWRQYARLAHNIPRFDLQATVELAAPGFALGPFHRQEAITWRTLRGRTATVSSIDTHEGGYTLYIGRRASDVLTRIYDKSAESPDLYPQPGVWRYEVEWKRDRALAAAKKLLAAKDGNAMILGMLSKHLEDRGLTPAFASLTREEVKAPPHRSDVATRLSWLRASVRPALDWLIEQGHGEDAWRILGRAEDPKGSD